MANTRRKGYQRQKEQKQAKTDKKRKRQVQERNLRKIIKAGSARQQEKKVNESQRINNDKCAKFKGSFGCFEVKGPKMSKL
ncbi:hypothetical protein Tco_1543919, partial [Tanacetum coccineum]